MLNKIKTIPIIILLFSITIIAQENVLTSYNIFDLDYAIDAQISPDGNYISFTKVEQRKFEGESGGNYYYLYSLNTETGEIKELIGNKESVYGISWFPNSNDITFRGRFEGDNAVQVYKMNAAGGDTIALTDAENSVGDYGFNPDGTMIAYVSTESKPEVKERLLDKGFDAEIYEEEYQDLNLYIKDFNTGETKQITQGVSVFDFKWSPDGNNIAAMVADKNLVDYSYMFKRIYLINPESGEMKKIVENPGKLTQLSWSPDSKHLAFISATDVNDPVSGSIFVVNINDPKDFSELRNYQKEFEGAVTHVDWKNENTLLYSSEESVSVTLREQALDAENSTLLIEPGKVVFSSFSINDGTIAFAGNTSQHPGEVYTYDLTNSELEKHTNLNPWLKDIHLAKQEKISYKARDGWTIEGVLLYPLNYEEGKSYPLITYIHGGPESAVNNGWVTYYSMWGQVAAAQDYFVFMPNYRASAGRGEKFSRADFGDLADEEFLDVIDGIDYLINKGYVNRDQVGIGGGSYGGYFSAWAATKHSERFSAAVVFVGVSDQVSKRYTTDIPYEDYYVHWGFWTHENRDLVIDRSPVTHVLNNETPTLILHGKEDPRVHPSQSLELYRALKLHGNAPVRLVWYPGQGHGNRKNTSRLDYNLRTMRWFNYYLKDQGNQDEKPSKYLDVNVK